MRKIIDNYLNLGLERNITKYLEDSDYDIEDQNYSVKVKIKNNDPSNIIRINGQIYEEEAIFNITEISDTGGEYKFSTKTKLGIIKKDAKIVFRRLEEKNLNIYDYEGQLIRSQSLGKDSITRRYKISEKDINKDLLSKIEIIKPLAKNKSL